MEIDQLQKKAEKYCYYNTPEIFKDYGEQTYMDAFREGEIEAQAADNRLILAGVIIGVVSTSLLWLILHLSNVI